MRSVGMTLAGLMLVALAAQAQQPAGVPGMPPGPGAPAAQPFPNAPPPAAPADPVLDQHLLGWEKAIQGVSNFYTEFELKKTEAAFKRDRMLKGSVLCMKPNFARRTTRRTSAMAGRSLSTGACRRPSRNSSWQLAPEQPVPTI